MKLTAKLVAAPTRLGGIGLGNLTASFCALKYYASVTAVRDKVTESSGGNETHIRDLDKAAAAAMAASELKPAGRATEVDLENPHHLQRTLVDLAASSMVDALARSMDTMHGNFLKGLACPAAAAIFRPEAGWNNRLQTFKVHDAHWLFRLRLFIPLLPATAPCGVGTCTKPADRYGHHGMNCRGGSDDDTHPCSLRKSRHNHVALALALAINRFTRHSAQHEEKEGCLPVDRYLTRRADAGDERLEADIVITHADGPRGVEMGIPKNYYTGKQAQLAKQPPPPGSPPPPPGTHTLGDVVIKGQDGSSAHTEFRRKMRKYVDIYHGVTPMSFMPLAFATSGQLDPVSLEFIRALCKSGDKRNAYEDAVVCRKVLGGMARALQRGNVNLLRAYMYKHAMAHKRPGLAEGAPLALAPAPAAPA
jgi:hypothetical protein